MLILPLASALPPGEINPWMILPFGTFLLLIAAGPIFFEHWWHRNYPKIATILAVIPVVYYLFVLHQPERMLHVAHEYVSFIALIGSLFVVAGGVHLAAPGGAKPWHNVLFLLIGAIVANVIGTTGASMLMIRPWVRMNRQRIGTFHIIFFIFIVSNVGGCLTPIGDPPLFLGYLKGVPFFWVLQSCWVGWLIVVSLLLAVFYIFDWRSFRRAPREATAPVAWRCTGLRNLIFLVLILGAILGHKFLPPLVPDFIMLAAAAASYFLTPKVIHRENEFSFEAMQEVAWLFVGIFATMAPALDYLTHHAEQLNLQSPLAFYGATGVLSAFLDNAPTYLTFLAVAMGGRGLDINSPPDVLTFIAHDHITLVAISLAAVFFGACTYIGNGPNFMVKNISRQLGVETPSFFGYLLRYAVPILIPIYALVALLFFSPWRIF